jgi:cytochrome b
MEYVWDAFVRASHWLLVGAFGVAYWTHDSIWERDIHAEAGYVAGTLLIARLFWGFGSQGYARFSSFPFQPLQGLTYIRQLLLGHAARYIGHNPAGSLVIYLMIVDGLLSIGSGWWVYNDGWVPAFSLPLAELHHFFSWAWVWLVLMHISGVLFESFAHKENLVWAMITGYKKK